MIDLIGKYSSCKIFATTVDDILISQVYTLLNYQAFKGETIRIMPDCLTEDTEVLTKNGFKLIKDLNNNDEIANYDSVNKKVFFAKPKNIIIRPLKKDETIYEYYNKQHNFSFKVSENHRMAIKDKMGQLAKDTDQIRMADMVFNANGLNDDCTVNHYSDNEIKLIAWIVGDGNIEVTHNAKSDNYRIRFGLKKMRKIDKLIDLLKEENINYSISSSEKQEEIYINTKDSVKYINFVTLDKKLPQDFILLNKHQSEIFINEIILIDGDYEKNKNKQGYRVNGKSKYDLDIISAILCINNRYSKINLRKTKHSFGTYEVYYINGIDYDKLQYSKSGVHNRLINRRTVDYTGDLVCVECETSYFIARQNGLTFITGNCHPGKGCVIGFTSTVTDKVIPSIVGFDIGCGVNVIKLKEKYIDFEKLDEVIDKYVPSGFEIRERPHKLSRNLRINKLKCVKDIKYEVAMLGCGSLGGGNHYIEVDKDTEGYLYLVVHSGSRYLGGKVAQLYQDLAYKTMQFDYKMSIVNRLKLEGKEQDIQNVLKSVKMTHIEKDLAYLYGKNMENYLHDIDIVQEYAMWNRRIILDEIVRKMELTVVDEFTTIHNYIDTESRILRKGAISAQQGEKVIIPINMRDGAIIGTGKGNADWNFSAPHGAGRLFARRDCSDLITLEEFKKSMEGIWSTSVTESTIDESPMAYKPIEEILENVTETIDIADVIKPVYNFKAHKKVEFN